MTDPQPEAEVLIGEVLPPLTGPSPAVPHADDADQEWVGGGATGPDATYPTGAGNAQRTGQRPTAERQGDTRRTGKRQRDARHGGGRHGDSRHGDTRPGGSRHGTDRHGGERHGTDRHGSERHGADRRGGDRQGGDRLGGDRLGSERHGNTRRTERPRGERRAGNVRRADQPPAAGSSADRSPTDQPLHDQQSADQHPGPTHLDDHPEGAPEAAGDTGPVGGGARWRRARRLTTAAAVLLGLSLLAVWGGLGACDDRPEAEAPHAATPGSPAPDRSVIPGPGSLGSAPPSVPSRPEPAPVAQVTLRRTGGFAGVDQVLVVERDGPWSYIAAPGAPAERGVLTVAEWERLLALVRDPALRDEVGVPTPACNDGFVYDIAVGRLTLHYTDCGAPGPQPLTAAIVRLLTGATAL